MTTHELNYYRYLLGEIKRLQTECQAKSVMLDSWTTYGKNGVRTPWRADVDKMTKDPMFRSAVEANLEPHFSRIQRGLKDATTLQELLSQERRPQPE